MVRRVAETMEREAQLRSGLRSALLYPLVMVLVTFAVVVFLFTAIVPKFRKLFSGKDDILPVPTKVLMAVSRFFTDYWVWLLVGAAIAVIALVLFLRSAPGIRYLDAALMRLPAVGRLYRDGILARCSRTLGMLSEAGVPILTALEHTREVAMSPQYRDLWQDSHRHVTNGGTLAESLAPSRLIPPTFLQIVAAGESAANLHGVLLRVSDHITRDVIGELRSNLLG